MSGSTPSDDSSFLARCATNVVIFIIVMVLFFLVGRCVKAEEYTVKSNLPLYTVESKLPKTTTPEKPKTTGYEGWHKETAPDGVWWVKDGYTLKKEVPVSKTIPFPSGTTMQGINAQHAVGVSSPSQAIIGMGHTITLAPMMGRLGDTRNCPPSG